MKAPLDERLTMWVDTLRKDGLDDDADAMGWALAYLRESWAGTDRNGTDVDDMRTVAENAAKILATMERENIVHLVIESSRRRMTAEEINDLRSTVARYL